MVSSSVTQPSLAAATFQSERCATVPLDGAGVVRDRLTVVRMVPVAISLAGSHLRSDAILFIGWFGPRGLASIAFGLTAVVTLQEAGADATVLTQAVTWTVLLSVVLHGLSAVPLAARFGERAGETEDGIEEVTVAARHRWEIRSAEPPRR